MTDVPPSARAILEDAARGARPDHDHEGFLTATSGFLPDTPPLRALPESHRAWDELAANLSALIADQAVCRAVDTLPHLSADDNHLDGRYLCRTACLLSFIAHAYIHFGGREHEPAGDHPDGMASVLPPQLYDPLTTVVERLGRRGLGMTYSDLVLYNWQLRDPSKGRVVENIDLLVQPFQNDEERVFLATMVETVSASSVAVEGVVRCQECAAAGDVEGTKRELTALSACLRSLTYDTFMKIDPNPRAALHVDPLVWTKTLAAIAAPITPSAPGLSGGGAPIFALLDAFFERGAYETTMGKELVAVKAWMPTAQREFIAAVASQSVHEFVVRSGDTELMGLYQGALSDYAGQRGWLGLHRLKVYGFMETGFKAGRTSTNGGFSGEVQARAWEDLDTDIEAGRLERFAKHQRCTIVRRKAVIATTPDDNAGVWRVVLDVAGSGLRFQPGDRLGVLAVNSDELIDKTLAALRATGDETIGLCASWVERMRFLGHAEPETLPLRTFLAHAKLRPLMRSTAKALFRLGRSQKLLQVINARREDQWELWDVLELIGSRYQVNRLFEAEPWASENLSRLVPPERFRIYSISSAPVEALGGELHLTVGQLSFHTDEVEGEQPRERFGAASHFLTRNPEKPLQLAVRVIRPTRFRLPAQFKTPIVMFAGGTGISPFRGFLQARMDTACENWLFIGLRSPAQLHYRDELEAASRAGQLELRTAFSREDLRIRWSADADSYELVEGRRCYVDGIVEEEAEAIWRLLRSPADGGDGACFYVCGRTSFAHSVMRGLKRVIGKHCPAEEVDETFRNLMAEGRMMLDVFTTFAPAMSPGVLEYGPYDASEVAKHNNEEAGYWTIIQGQVYDVSEFIHLHPGGDRILKASAGIDGTRSYEKVEHHLSPEVHAMLDLYKIGYVRRLNFGTVSGIALTRQGVVHVSLHEAFRHWVRYLFSIVEIENSMNSNFSLKSAKLTSADADVPWTALKVDHVLSAHVMFLDVYMDMLFGENLDFIWSITTGLCSPKTEISLLSRRIAAVKGTLEARTTRGSVERIRTHCDQIAGPDDPKFATVANYLELMQKSDLALLAALKSAIAEGVQVFERHTQDVVVKGQGALVEALKRLPLLLRDYYENFAAHCAEMREGHPVVTHDTKARLAFLGSVELFNSFTPVELAEIAAASRTMRFEPGEILFRQGDPSYGMLVLQTGNVKLEMRLPGDRTLEMLTLVPGDVIGEVSLIDGGIRSASAIALTSTTGYLLTSEVFALMRAGHRPGALRLSRKLVNITLDRLGGEYRRLFGEAEEQPAAPPAMERWMIESTDTLSLDNLRALTIFRGFEHPEIETFLEHVVRLDIERDEVVFHRFQPAHCCYIVVRGAVQLVGDGPHGRVKLGVMGPGQLFGFQGLLRNGTRPVNARTRSKTVLLKITREELLAYLDAGTPTALTLLNALGELLVERLRLINRRVARVVFEGRMVT